MISSRHKVIKARIIRNSTNPKRFGHSKIMVKWLPIPDDPVVIKCKNPGDNFFIDVSLIGGNIHI